MSATDMATPYAMSGTDIGTDVAYAASHLRACYAMPGTDVSYGATTDDQRHPRATALPPYQQVLATLSACMHPTLRATLSAQAPSIPSTHAASTCSGLAYAVGVRACYGVRGTEGGLPPSWRKHHAVPPKMKVPLPPSLPPLFPPSPNRPGFA
eukprot:435442-Rhodomonas_salina.1